MLYIFLGVYKHPKNELQTIIVNYGECQEVMNGSMREQRFSPREKVLT